MFSLTASFRSVAPRAAPFQASARSFRTASVVRVDRSGGRDAATPSSKMSATSQQRPDGSPSPSSPQKSASDNTSKSAQQDAQEAERAMGGPEMAYGQYGGAAAQEGNFTPESEEGKARKAAAQQGEKK
ncbi:hypothetical protein JCM10212_003000 [Sporobolomyces blumeae]